MEFRTSTQLDNYGFNTQSPIVGGVGYNPTPQNFCYNGYGQGQYYQPNYNNSPGFINPPGGYVGSYNPQYQYGNFNQGYTQQPIIGLDGRPVIQNQTGGYYKNAWDLYNQRLQQEQEWKREQENQRRLWKQLVVLNRKFCGYDDGDEYFDKLEQQRQDRAAYEYKKMEEERQVLALYNLPQGPNSTDPNYMSYDYMNYVNNWNNIYNQRTEKYQGNITLYDFFNGGVGTEMMTDVIIEEAQQRAKDMSRLYSQDNFRQELAKSNPNYDPLTGTAGGLLTLNGMSGSRGLNIDDMEISLPPQ